MFHSSTFHLVMRHTPLMFSILMSICDVSTLDPFRDWSLTDTYQVIPVEDSE